MTRVAVLAAVVAAVFVACFAARKVVFEESWTPVSAGVQMTVRQGITSANYRRIISLAPSITETLFALGLGERVVGVTRYCEYPLAARERSRVGGYYDPNYEAIMSLSPDLVIMLPEHEGSARFFRETGIKTLVVNNKTVSDILHSIRSVGKICGVGQRGDDIARGLEARMQRIRNKTYRLKQPKVLVSIGGDMRSGAFQDICVVGRTGFYNEMVVLAGGANAYNGSIPFPSLTREGILALDPHVIVDMVPNLGQEKVDEETIVRTWTTAVARTRAVQEGRVYVFGQDYVASPGPRFILILEELARVLHPEAGWDR